jgi:alkylation response protein AidB-like acyl-CoA dehydrogenase
MNAPSPVTAHPESHDEVESLCAVLHRFGARLSPRTIDTDGRIPPPVLDELKGMGLLGLTIPEAYGGAGLGLQAACRVAATLARYDRSVATTAGLHMGLGTRGLVAYGSGALKERVLPRLATGTLGAFAATESNAGSDLTAVATKAMLDQDRLLVDGAKIYVTNGGLAGVFTLLVSTPWATGGRRAQSLLLLERTDHGLEVGAEEKKLGLRGSSTTSLFATGVEVSPDRIIGEPGTGARQASHVLSWGRTVMASGCLGSAGAALDAALRHVTTRKQFGRTLAQLDVVREQVADMAATHFAMEALIQDTAASVTDEELLARSLGAKVVCSEGGWQIGDTALQLHGGSGFIEDTGLALVLRDLRITRIFEGANDVLLVHAGTLAVTTGMPVTDPALDGLPEDLRAHHQTLRQRFSTHLAEVKLRHGVRLLGDQRRLHRIGRLATLRASCDAAVRRAASEGTSLALAHAAHWLQLSAQQQARWLDEPAPKDTVSAIAEAHYGRVTP